MYYSRLLVLRDRNSILSSLSKKAIALACVTWKDRGVQNDSIRSVARSLLFSAPLCCWLREFPPQVHFPHAEGSLAARKSKPMSPSLRIFKASLVAQLVKNLPALQETQVQFLGQEDPLEKEMETHSSILAWEIPWTEERWATVHGVAKESDMT